MEIKLLQKSQIYGKNIWFSENMYLHQSYVQPQVLHAIQYELSSNKDEKNKEMYWYWIQS